MPLPQQIINQLNHDPAETPGWLSGLLLFSCLIFGIVLILYFGLLMVYQPKLNTDLTAAQEKVAATDQSIASGDQTQLIDFYSQVVNMQGLLRTHILFSQFLSWLEKHTEANVYYSQLSFASGNQITITATARTQADVSQQVAIFESSPSVKKVIIPSVTAANGGGGGLSFAMTLIMDPLIFVATTTSNP
jgi:hypothetical protein